MRIQRLRQWSRLLHPMGLPILCLVVIVGCRGLPGPGGASEEERLVSALKTRDQGTAISLLRANPDLGRKLLHVEGVADLTLYLEMFSDPVPSRCATVTRLWPALYVAAWYGADGVADLLIRQADLATSDFCARDKGFDNRQGSPLHWFILRGRTRLADDLIYRGLFVNTESEFHVTPLHVATQVANVALVKRLIKAGADVTKRKDDRYTPLHLAAARGNLDIVEVLVAAGADVNAVPRDPQDACQTVLAAAAGSGSWGVIRYLLAHGARITADEGVVYAAVYGRNADVVQGLYEAGFKPDFPKAFPQQSPLLVALDNGDAEIVDILLQHGVEPDGKLDPGLGWFHVCARRGVPDLSKQIMDFRIGRKIESKYPSDEDALAMAAEDGNVAWVAYLLRIGVDANAGLSYEVPSTPLHMAVKGGQTETAGLLLKAGARIDAKDGKGRTPFDLAEGKGDTRMLAVLRAALPQPPPSPAQP